MDTAEEGGPDRGELDVNATVRRAAELVAEEMSLQDWTRHRAACRRHEPDGGNDVAEFIPTGDALPQRTPQLSRNQQRERYDSRAPSDETRFTNYFARTRGAAAIPPPQTGHECDVDTLLRVKQVLTSFRGSAPGTLDTLTRGASNGPRRSRGRAARAEDPARA
jgi:hypothetical protein